MTEGKRLIALDITQMGISDDGDDFNALYFAVQDSDGYVYGPELAGADVEPEFGSGELAAGQVVRGWVAFELPETSRLVSVMVEAEVFGSRITITEFTQDQAGDMARSNSSPSALTSVVASSHWDDSRSWREFVHLERGKGPCSRRYIRCD